MLLFLDTEFTDFHHSELISLALVSESGRQEFYAERNDFDASRCSAFVRSAVLPKLGGGLSVDRNGMAVALRTWLHQVHALDSMGAVIVMYDFDTDFSLFLAALDGDVPIWLSGANVADQVNHAGWAKEGLEDSTGAHHALHDAHVLRADWLATQAAGFMP